MNTPPRKGFTLIEMLIVMALLGILAGLLFPVLAEVRERGRRTVCAANLSQIGIAAALYRADYDDHFPYAVDNWTRHTDLWAAQPFYQDIITGHIPNFPTVLFPYTHQNLIFRCPSDTGTIRASKPDFLPTNFDYLQCSYFFDEGLALFGIPEHLLPRPSQTPYSFDTPTQWHIKLDWDRRGNCLYVDGHVKFVSDHKRGE